MRNNGVNGGLTRDSYALGLRELAQRDRDLGRVIETYGPPPMWARKPGFPTLVHIILEQQVSLASARAAFNRLAEAVSPLTPERFLRLRAPTLKRIGFSRQKTGYARHLAESIVDGRLALDKLAKMSDGDARAALLELKGIGPWSADVYLLMALRRPDVWPSGDLALASAVHEVKQLRSRPSVADLDEIGMAWKPWRAVAARLLWHHNLSK